MAAKPPSEKSRMVASTPPVMTTSAAPRRINSAASPTDCVPEAQAVTIVLSGPSV
jgi:hypothetical protein